MSIYKFLYTFIHKSLETLPYLWLTASNLFSFTEEEKFYKNNIMSSLSNLTFKNRFGDLMKKTLWYMFWNKTHVVGIISHAVVLLWGQNILLCLCSI